VLYCCVHLVTNTARWLRHEDETAQNGMDVTFKYLLFNYFLLQ